MKTKLKAYRIKLNKGGYSSSGDYYGLGLPIYQIAVLEGTHEYYLTTVRAKDAKEAKLIALARSDIANPQGVSMATKKKKATKRKAVKKAAKNPRRHVPKLKGRGRPPKQRTFTMRKMDANGGFLGNVTKRGGSVADAENKALSLVKGKVAKVLLEY